MKKSTSVLFAILIMSSTQANATNIYNPTSGQITLDYVVYGGNIYANVIITASDYKIGTSGTQCTSTRTYSYYDATINTFRLDSVSNTSQQIKYCDVDIVAKEIKSYSDVTPVEIYTNTYNPASQAVTVDYVPLGNYNYYNYAVTFSGVAQNNQTSFFNLYNPSTNTATLHSAIDLSSGAILNYDFYIGVKDIVKTGATIPLSGAKTTVLVYILGSDLEEDVSAGSLNIQEMTKVGSTDSMTVIVQTGGATRAGTENFGLPVNWTHVQRWKVGQWNSQTPNDFSQSLTLLNDLGGESPQTAGTPDLDMGISGTLNNFIQWGMNAYPADKFILVMGSHSGGINGTFGPDTITNSSMTIPAIVGAIKSSPKQFELIAFDSCLNGTAEIAAGLALRANFMVASEDLQAGAGYDYTTFLQQVAKYPDAGGNVIGKALAGSYYLKTTQNNNVYARPSSQETSSVIDLTKIANLKAATDDFSSNLKRYAASDAASWLKIARARANALDFATSSIIMEPSDLVDMRQFVANIKTEFNSDAVLGAASDKLTAAIDGAVVYNKKSLADQSATGLTVYFPSMLSSFPNQNYAQNTVVNSVPFFSVNYADRQSGLLSSYYGFYSENKPSLTASIGSISNSGGLLSVVVTNPIQTAMAALGNNNCNLLISGKSEARKCYQAVTDAQQTPTGAATTVSFNKNPPLLWPLLNGFPAVLIQNSPIRSGYGDYIIPVTHNNKDGFLRVTSNKFDNTYLVDGFIGYLQQPSNLTPIQNGDRISMRYFSADNYLLYRSADSGFVVQSLPLSVSLGAVSANDQFTFITTDLTGTIAKAIDIPY